MLKHYINIFDNTYYIEDNGVIIMSISLKEENNIEIRTPKQDIIGSVNDLHIHQVIDSE